MRKMADALRRHIPERGSHIKFRVMADSADLLDEAEKALADIAQMPLSDIVHTRTLARTTLARIRGEK